MSRYATAHQNPQGADDARPTALQIIHDEDLLNKLPDKTIFITGANQGIGLETARALHATGAAVYLGVRDPVRGQQAIDDIKTTNPTSTGTLHLVPLSLDSLASVRACAASFLSQSPRLNILILNAGIMSGEKTATADGFEKTFATNHLGHHLLFQLLKPALLASSTPSSHSRVVAVSSQMHRATEIRLHDLNLDEPGSYSEYLAYSHSKLANVYLATEVERRYGGRGLHGLPLHPGSIVTNLNREHLEKGAERIKATMGDRWDELVRSMKSTAQGAATTVYAAVGREWEGRGGRYLSDCVEVGPADPGSDAMAPDTGYATWAYDADKAEKLWRECNRMVGLEEDE